MSTNKSEAEIEATQPKQDTRPAVAVETTRSVVGGEVCIRPNGTDEVVCDEVVEKPPAKHSDDK